MKKNRKKINILTAGVLTFLGSSCLYAQETVTSDSIKVKTEDVKGDDRNMMLNAASANTGPREVNVGLPATVGGTTVLENNLPVVYFYWPEFPYKSWRMDAMTNGVKVRDLGQTAIHVGDVGFSMDTYDNLGTDNFRGNGSLGSNHFGLIKQDLNISGPVGDKGYKFSVGTFINFDPGTYKNKYTERYYNDQTVLLKAALSKDYTFSTGKGSIALLYKYASSKSMSTQLSAPYIYKKDGSVKELKGFKIGGDSYISGQMYSLKDAYTDERVERDALNDYDSQSHTIDLIGKNTFDNGLHFNYIIRAHSAQTGSFLPVMTGISANTGGFTYADTGEQYTGDNVQGVMVIASRRTPIKSLTSNFEVGKKTGKHDWNIGLNAWVYDIDKFLSESTLFYQEVAANPRRLQSGINPVYFGDGNEYHDGTETKTALYATDKWEISDVFSLNLGARLEFQTLRGNYIDNDDIVSRIPYMDNKKTNINKDFFSTAFMASAVYKMTRSFGLLGEVTYNEQGGHLENYSAGNYPDLKKSIIPSGTFGVYYNHPMFSVVSKATYIQKNNYRGTVNFTNPNDISEVNRAGVKYEIQTIGWTTDVVATPFKDFNLHFLLTLQSPKYKNYKGAVEFAGGDIVNYNFNNKIVNKVSKVLIEIDPSYQWGKLRIWASARYFSKTYANLSNSLQLASRWETFAGLNYAFNSNLDLGVSFINLLNQRGAQGTISGTDLLTDEQVEQKIGADGVVVSGTYIRPFTVEFSLKYKF